MEMNPVHVTSLQLRNWGNPEFGMAVVVGEPTSGDPFCQGIVAKKNARKAGRNSAAGLEVPFFFRLGKRRFNIRGDARPERLADRPFLFVWFVCVK